MGVVASFYFCVCSGDILYRFRSNFAIKKGESHLANTTTYATYINLSKKKSCNSTHTIITHFDNQSVSSFFHMVKCFVIFVSLWAREQTDSCLDSINGHTKFRVSQTISKDLTFVQMGFWFHRFDVVVSKLSARWGAWFASWLRFTFGACNSGQATHLSLTAPVEQNPPNSEFVETFCLFICALNVFLEPGGLSINWNTFNWDF